MKILPPAKSAFWIYFIISTVIGAVVGYHYLTGLPVVLMATVGFIAAGAFLFLLTIALPFLYTYLKKIPARFILVAMAFVITFVVIEQEFFRLPVTAFYIALAVILFCGVIWEVGWNWVGDRSSALHKFLILTPIVAILGVMVYLVLRPGVDAQNEELPSKYYSDTSTNSQFQYERLLKSGDFSVDSFTYGSGDDKNRSEYDEAVRFITDRVDATLLLPQWDSVKQKYRQKFLGYGIDELPLNARVYMPEGEGPFPLFMIVHGNHSMIDWSDGGYAYLGEHLASRGIMTVSVDENFVNGHWSGDFRGKEMPVRAWILLKHLEQLNKWNKESGHDLAGKINMDKIILAGHSRGGEAVQIAAVFNELERFPEDGNEVFDFDFNIQGIISIAPTDYRYDRQVSMKNVNYLSLQGSYDSDESSFWGMRAFRRLTFTDSLDYFKAGVYVHRANHSQFNSDWGRSDAGIPRAWFLNRGALIDHAEQRKIAKFYITGFAEKVFERKEIPDQLFTDLGAYRSLLPDTYILTHYSESNTKPLIQFGEDSDILTGNEYLSLKGENLLIWKESDLKSRDNESLQNYGLTLGWYVDSLQLVNNPASYEIKTDSLLFPAGVNSINFTLGIGDYKALKSKLPDSLKLKEPDYDFTIELSDVKGEKVAIQVNEIKQLAPRLFSEFAKVESMNKSLGKWEVQTETFHLVVDELLDKNASFSPDSIQFLKFVFDQHQYGVIVVDEISYSVNRPK